MRFMAWNVFLSSWLIVSTFAFAQGGTSTLLSWATALLVSVVAVLSPAKTALRFLISLASFVLFWSAILLPDVPWPARVNNAIVGAVLFALSMVRPATSKPAETAAA
jgi:hypothetical protein